MTASVLTKKVAEKLDELVKQREISEEVKRKALEILPKFLESWKRYCKKEGFSGFKAEVWQNNDDSGLYNVSVIATFESSYYCSECECHHSYYNEEVVFELCKHNLSESEAETYADAIEVLSGIFLFDLN